MWFSESMKGDTSERVALVSGQNSYPYILWTHNTVCSWYAFDLFNCRSIMPLIEDSGFWITRSQAIGLNAWSVYSRFPMEASWIRKPTGDTLIECAPSQCLQALRAKKFILRTLLHLFLICIIWFSVRISRVAHHRAVTLVSLERVSNGAQCYASKFVIAVIL